MSSKLVWLIKGMVFCTLVGGLMGCGGAFVQGQLGLSQCGEYSRLADSLEVRLIQAGDTSDVARFPVVLTEDSTRATFKFSKNALARKLGGRVIDEKRDSVIVKFEKFINPLLVAYRDSAGQGVVDTLRASPGDFTHWNCNNIRAQFPQLVDRDDVRRVEKHYLIMKREIVVPLPSPSRSRIDLDISGPTPGAQTTDCFKDLNPIKCIDRPDTTDH